MRVFSRVLAVACLLAAGQVVRADDCCAPTNDFLKSGVGPEDGRLPVCCCEPACDECACMAGCGWYGQAEALFWTRSNNSSRVAVVRVSDEGNALPGDTVLLTNSPAFNFQPGARILVGWRQDECRACEFSYFGLFSWNAEATATGNNDLAIPGDLGLASLDYFAADQIVLNYQTRLHNVEANLVRSNGEWSYLAGFRYLSLNEEFRIRSTDLDTGTSDYQVQAANNLFGVQLGVRLNKSFDRFGWDATAKAGLFGNAENQSQSVPDFPPGFLLRDGRSAAGSEIAFVGDINLSGHYRVSDVWAFRGGYNLLWVEGVALAPNQLDFTDTPASGTQLQSGGGFFAHGVSIGVEAFW